MDNITLALATDDGEHFINRHFGDADMYKIYEISPDKAELVSKIDNTVDEEDVHADPEKAKGIAILLKEEGVKVVASNIFGPNIKRIKKKFVCIVLDDNTLEEGLQKIQNNFDEIIAEWKKGQDREYLVYKND